MSDTGSSETAPGYTPEFGRRIAVAIDGAGGTLAAGRTIGQPQDALEGWRDGTRAILFHELCALAAAAGVSPAWLAFGDELETATTGRTVPIEAVKETWEFWIPVILRLTDRPDPATLRDQFLADVLERAVRSTQN